MRRVLYGRDGFKYCHNSSAINSCSACHLLLSIPAVFIAKVILIYPETSAASVPLHGGHLGLPRWWRFVCLFLPSSTGRRASTHVLMISRRGYADRSMRDDVSGTEECLCQAR